MPVFLVETHENSFQPIFFTPLIKEHDRSKICQQFRKYNIQYFLSNEIAQKKRKVKQIHKCTKSKTTTYIFI